MAAARSDILDCFLADHGDHYSILAPLGEGAYGFTYRARDTRRQIDVCLKFFLDGVAPTGAQRDWRITSTIKHPLVCDTFTVEHFSSDSLAQPGIAVVSRFIPGRDLGYVVDRYRELSPEQQDALRDALVAEVGNDICTAIRACHEAGFGHGDLSERNVMISMSSEPHGKRFTATVIDFDNATYKPELRDLEESRLIEKDARSLVRLIGMLTFETRWHDGMQRVLNTCETVRQVHESFDFMLRIAKRLDGDSSDAYGEQHWNGILRTLLAASMVGGPHMNAVRQFIEVVADDVGQRPALEAQRTALEHRILHDPNYPQMSMSMEMRERETEDAARSLVQ